MVFFLLAIALVQQPTGGSAGGQEMKPVDLRKVEQGVADGGPLSTRGRVQPLDLRVSNDFRDVYQIPVDAPGPYAGWFLRQSGGVYALFPRSTYVSTSQGTMITVPPNTRYLIASPSELAAVLGLVEPATGQPGATAGAPLSLAVNTATTAGPSVTAPISQRLADPGMAREVLRPSSRATDQERTATSGRVTPALASSGPAVAQPPTAGAMPAQPLTDAGQQSAAIFESAAARDAVVASMLQMPAGSPAAGPAKKAAAAVVSPGR